MVAVNQISLYKKVTPLILNESGVQILGPKISYKNDEGLITEVPLDISDKVFTESQHFMVQVNEHEAMWSPNDNNLWIEQVIKIDNPSRFFGDLGVTNEKNTIGIACHVYSKSSGFQKTRSFGEFKSDTKSIVLTYVNEFSPASLRGEVYFEYFFYLKEAVKVGEFEAQSPGMRLSEDDLLKLSLIVDGSGASFPMSEFSDKEGPLWKLDKNWVDANMDPFDNTSVNLSLNTAHPLFKALKKDTDKKNRALMGDIMIQAMAMLIQQVVIIENNIIEDEEDAYPGSILAAVTYWISTFDIDTSDIFSIHNSLRGHLDRQFIGGEMND